MVEAMSSFVGLLVIVLITHDVFRLVRGLSSMGTVPTMKLPGMQSPLM